MKKMLFLINPKAGNSGIKGNLLQILSTFCYNGYEVRVHTTSAPCEITRIIAAEGEHYDIVVTSGGDGTLNESVAGLTQLRQPPVLGYIPAGTMNDVAASLHLSLDPQQAAQDIVFGEDTEIDIGSFGGRAFSYVAAFGAFTDVPYITPQESKRAFGRLAYLFEGVKTLPSIKPIHARVTANGETEEDDFLLGLICSTKSVAGLRAKSLEKKLDISLSDGLFEIIFLRNIHNVVDLNNALTKALLLDFADKKSFYYVKAGSVHIEFDREIAWTLDGEDGGSHRAADISVLPRALKIRTPR
ncbi:MAG: diacylglycerol kinase family lipid kinase [Oscillospiraceae bacterium]|nr:diacylglycerol kinase family lipid kinase [Oscillospiraceae bacterium]